MSGSQHAERAVSRVQVEYLLFFWFIFKKRICGVFFFLNVLCVFVLVLVLVMSDSWVMHPLGF